MGRALRSPKAFSFTLRIVRAIMLTMMERLVLIIGATGHSGRYAIERLAQRWDDCRGLRIRALVRATSDVEGIIESRLPIELFYGDVLDDACLTRALDGVDTVLNIFGIINDPARVAQFCANAGVRRLISVHTTGVYSKYKSASADYMEADRRVKEVCKANGVALTILRPTMIYGGLDDQNVVRFIRMMDRLPLMPVVNGAQYPLQPVHRRDLGYAYADVLLAGETCFDRDYVLSGKEPILLSDMLRVIAGYLGKEARFVSVPYWIAITGAWGVYALTLTKVDYREKVQRLVEPRAYPHDDATRDFGYAPVGFSEGVADEVTAYILQKRTRG